MCTSLTRRGFSRKTSEKADLVCSCDVVCSALTRADGLQMNVVFKGKGQISLPRAIVFGKVIWLFVMSALRGLITLPRSRYMDRYFSCSFSAFFLPEKESSKEKQA